MTVIVLSGLVALTMNNVIQDAEAHHFSNERVQFLEESIVEKLESYANVNKEDWRSIQNTLLCCGYQNPNEVDAFMSDEFVGRLQTLNSISGDLCTYDVTWCGPDTLPCPRREKSWCRDEFLMRAQANSAKIGLLSMILGLNQTFAFFLALYVLLCDGRIEYVTSPEEKI